MSDTLDELESDKIEKSNYIIFILIGFSLYYGISYAKPIIATLDNYLYGREIPVHFHYWLMHLFSMSITLLIVNIAGNWFIKNVDKLSSIQLLTPFVIFFVVSFILNWTVSEYYEELYGFHEENYYDFWREIDEYYNDNWMTRIVTFATMLFVFLLFLYKTKKVLKK
jgi:hypothetical protein